MLIWLLHTPVLAGLCWYLTKQHEFSKWSLAGLLAKLVGAMAFALLYWFYYQSGDSLDIYHELALILNKSRSFDMYLDWLLSPIDPYSANPRTAYLLRILSPLAWATQANYWILTLYLAMFSFSTTWSLIRSLTESYKQLQIPIILSLGFLPSLLFWGSGLSKDTIANGCFFFLLGLVLDRYDGRSVPWFRLALGFLAFGALFLIKHYLAGTSFFLAILLFLYRAAFSKGMVARALVFALVVIIGGIGIRYFFVRLRPERFPLTFYELHEQVIAKSDAANTLFFDLEPTWPSLLSNVPKALISGLFMPLPWTGHHFLSMLLGIENLILLLLTLLSLRYINLRAVWQPKIVVGLCFILLMATTLPLANPNLGTLSRYKSAYLPLFCLIISMIPYRKWARLSA